MRLTLLAALLSTVLMPVTAEAQRHDRGGHGARVERSARPAATPRATPRATHRAPTRATRPATRRAPTPRATSRTERRSPARAARPQGQRATTRPIQRVDPNRFRRGRDDRATTARRADRPRAGTWQQRANRNDRARQWNRGDRNDRTRQWNRGDRTDRTRRWNQANRHDRDRLNRARADYQRRWNRSNADWNDHYRGNDHFRGRVEFNRRWRDDRRYNWRDWRVRNRAVYRLPRYYAPQGWNYGYRRFSIGFRLDSLLFGSGYWINDPYYYRLPPAYGPYRWVRYYNDALLVDIDTGEVVDVVYDIFW